MIFMWECSMFPNLGMWIPMKGHVLEEYLMIPHRNMRSRCITNCHIFLVLFNMGTHDFHVGMFNVPQHGNAHSHEGIGGSRVGTFNVPQHGEWMHILVKRGGVPMKAREVPMWNIQCSPIWVVHSCEGTCGSHVGMINVPQHGNLHSH